MARNLFLFFVFGSLFINSCGSGSTERIKIDGSSTVYPMTEALAEEYRTESPNTRITVGLSGTGGGFQKFLRGKTDINDASREIQPGEIETAEKNGVEYIKLKVAYDGIAVVVHPDNDWVDYFTVKELKKIWQPSSQNEVTHWNDVKSEWPDDELHLYGAGTASGTYDYFTEAVVGESGASRGDYTASEDDNVLVQGVSGDDNALGYFGLAYYEENQQKLRLVPIENENGKKVKPTTESVAKGTYSPLSRPLYIYVSKKAAQRESVREFVNYYLDTAGELAKDVGYVAMPDSVYKAEKEKFREFYTGAESSSAMVQ